MLSPDHATPLNPAVTALLAELVGNLPHEATPPDVLGDWFDRAATLTAQAADDPSTTPEAAADLRAIAAWARSNAATLRAHWGGEW
jgi:hypothetical protein